ncbi:MAG: helicase [Aurantimonas sp.]|nr:helicase [Aurantimonas sp.]
MSESETTSIYQSDLPIENKLERARTELLDLSARNRLLNVPRFSKAARTIDIIDERSAEIYRLLAKETKAFTFSAGRPDRAGGGDAAEEDEDLHAIELAQPDEADDEVDERGRAKRHLDTKLQTRMTPKGLQKRLLDLYHDARTLEEEQGVNVLFLALGMLRWVDPNNKENIRHAPLVLVPVKLERGTAGERFRLRVRPEDQTSNLSLEAYLDRVHALRLPAFEGGDEFDPDAYFREVADAVSTKTDWSVLPDDIVLGFFSFSKFLMYRDLDPENWPSDGRITDQATIRSLLSDGFEAGEPLLSEDERIDRHIDPADMLHIVDSDGSQTLAVHDVRRGRDLVIQGPPGTGKSQTIANVIASAIADGKTVLFVAEKMAALDVVKRRLDNAGVGDACIELHSNKANKRGFLEELRRTWELGSPRGEFPSSLTGKLRAARDVLNLHAERMHVPHEASGLTPYQVFGALTKLRQEGQRPVDLPLETATLWSPDDLASRRRLLVELTQRVDEIGLPISHPWHGVGLDLVLPTTLERLLPRIESLQSAVSDLEAEYGSLAKALEMEPEPITFDDAVTLRERAAILARAPDLSPEAFRADAWDDRREAVADLVRAGADFRQHGESLVGSVHPSALGTSIEGLEVQLAWLPREFPTAAFGRAAELAESLPRLRAEADRLATELGVPGPVDTLAAVSRLVTTGERVAAAPDASPEAFAATVWDQGVEQAGDLAEAVETLERSRAAIGDRILDVAWTTEVSSARQALAINTGFLKALNGDYRKAKALMRSILRNPEMPTQDIVELLDTLMKGQAAAKRVQDDDAFGRSAFGADWRGERSASAPLLALVAWMRTLRGLGAEPRLIAGRLAERQVVGEHAALVLRHVDATKPLLEALWSDLGTAAAPALDNAVSADRAQLDMVEARARNLAWADGLCRTIMRSVPDTLSERLDAVAGVAAWQAAAQSLDERTALGAEAFGLVWKGQDSNWDELAAAVEWIDAHDELRHLAARLSDRTGVAERAGGAVAASANAQGALAEVASFLLADPRSLFGADDYGNVRLQQCRERMETWLANSEQLSKWVSYRERADRARTDGMAVFVDNLEDGRLATPAALPSFEMAYHEAILSELIRTDPELGRFDGNLHGRHVREFANLDRERIKSASLEVVRAHHRRIPPRDGGVGPVGILRGEMAKRSRHMPIRQLMQRAGPAIQALKPVMMMSPLSVAQFLTPGKMTYDLLVMDEASQIQPVDALGAIARARQVVVVGDERQLPPTKFFSKMTGGTESDDEEDGAQVADIESILGLFTARGLPQRMLRWHYRSRHQSLIAVSNTQFYQNKLFIVPSPYTTEAGMGLQFHHVPDGVFDSGGTSVNAVEARTVAEAVIWHAKTSPGQSFGVATFSVSQRRAIQDELEFLRRLNPDTEEFFHAHPSEPFFVKNLENVQGDERDVIMISVGYAKNAQGYMAMRFGPLGAQGGERRLNVLISRAKRRCEVYASITDEDIDLERGKGAGILAFKLFLHYARTGRLSIAQASGRDMDSVFEEQVASALQAKGYQVHPQVGIAGFFIDLAVSDPERPGRYLIGIECDGASYHSSRSARDRDRLRQAVLEDHGWIIHRIWSTDWFQRPQEQLERTVAAIEAAKAELDERMERGLAAHRAVPIEIVTVDRGEVTEVGLGDAVPENGTVTAAYIEATLSRPGPYELHETPVGRMADLVAQVVQVESPVHLDEVVARVRDAFGLQRAGARIQAAVVEGVERAITHREIFREGDFLSLANAEAIVRDRRDALSSGLRKPETLPPAELRAGILRIVTDNFGATDDEVAGALSRQLGFKATSAQLRAVIASAVEALLVEGRLQRQDRMLSSFTASGTDSLGTQEPVQVSE